MRSMISPTSYERKTETTQSATPSEMRAFLCLKINTIYVAHSILIVYLDDVMRLLTELIAELLGALLIIGGFFFLYYILVPTY